MTSARTVSVLGLGRMGSAVALHLSAKGWRVRGWARSGRPLESVDTASDPAAAVNGASYVVVALFDGAACREVLHRCSDELGPANLVVNLSTVSPAEAIEFEELVTRAGAAYLHAPVLGSVGAATTGQLTVLAGSGPDSTRVERVVSALGTPVWVGDSATAAKAKLLANGALGAVLFAVQEALTNADELGLPRAQALDVLAESVLAPIVGAKRLRLIDGDTAHADFTIDALLKDLALLGELTTYGKPLSDRVAGQMRARQIPDDSDIAALALPSAPGLATTDPFEHGLTVAPEVTGPPEVLEPLLSYVRGHATGDPSHFREAFLPTAHVEGIRDGRFVSWRVDDYYTLFDGQPADDEPKRRRRIDSVFVEGTIATATMTLWHGRDTFTDTFLLVSTDHGWRIANKLYYRHDRIPNPNQT